MRRTLHMAERVSEWQSVWGFEPARTAFLGLDRLAEAAVAGGRGLISSRARGQRVLTSCCIPHILRAWVSSHYNVQRNRALTPFVLVVNLIVVLRLQGWWAVSDAMSANASSATDRNLNVCALFHNLLGPVADSDENCLSEELH